MGDCKIYNVVPFLLSASINDTCLKNLFNKYLEHGKISNSWSNASVLIMHKKGKPVDLKKYRPIRLLSQL